MLIVLMVLWLLDAFAAEPAVVAVPVAALGLFIGVNVVFERFSVRVGRPARVIIGVLTALIAVALVARFALR